MFCQQLLCLVMQSTSKVLTLIAQNQNEFDLPSTHNRTFVAQAIKSSTRKTLHGASFASTRLFNTTEMGNRGATAVEASLQRDNVLYIHRTECTR